MITRITLHDDAQGEFNYVREADDPFLWRLHFPFGVGARRRELVETLSARVADLPPADHAAVLDGLEQLASPGLGHASENDTDGRDVAWNVALAITDGIER